MSERLTYSVLEASELLGISRSRVYLAIHSGDLPHLRFGRRVVIPRVALHQMIDQAGSAPQREIRQ